MDKKVPPVKDLSKEDIPDVSKIHNTSVTIEEAIKTKPHNMSTEDFVRQYDVDKFINETEEKKKEETST